MVTVKILSSFNELELSIISGDINYIRQAVKWTKPKESIL